MDTEKYWTTKRGSKVWVEGTLLRVQAYGGDVTHDLKDKLDHVHLEVIDEGDGLEYFVRVVFDDYYYSNAGRYKTPAEASSLALAIMNAVS